ncbi:hydrolase of the alpha/beta superfamily [Labilithrix luteola]|uniref:Hydrolase of the alpha/beta superfamily n=1 Tax=Labilithrix luteola TaxID=1391654 RepID=A0A0K1Q5V1_9BACT|nr:alpha/beta fold hydrolase [Labilithrix luteola]AKV00765.1 hydrolase of the alpha/beta superfamily [Labilithrix luteola]
MEELDSYLFNRHLRTPESPDSQPPKRESGRDVRIPARDGFPLEATIFERTHGRGLDEHASDPRARVIVIASATGVRRGFYAGFATYLAARGFDVVTFDYRGIGASRADEQSSASVTMRDWGELDLAAVVTWAADMLGDGRISVVGHSVGGQLLGLLPEPSRIRAAVTVGAQSGDYRLWPMPSRLLMALLWYGVVPSVTKMVGYLPGKLGIGEDLPPGVALEWARWCRTPDYLVGDGGDSRRASFARLEAPVLAYGFDDDGYAPEAAVDALMSFYTGARIERRQLGRSDGRFGHFGFFRRRHEALWNEVAGFLGKSR